MPDDRRTPSLGTDLRAIRRHRGLSLRTLAAQVGLSYEGLSGVERGSRYPNLATLEAIARGLNVRIVIGPEDTVIEVV